MVKRYEAYSHFSLRKLEDSYIAVMFYLGNDPFTYQRLRFSEVQQSTITVRKCANASGVFKGVIEFPAFFGRLQIEDMKIVNG